MTAKQKPRSWIMWACIWETNNLGNLFKLKKDALQYKHHTQKVKKVRVEEI